MKEKYILYILIILTVIANSNCFPVNPDNPHQHDDDPSDVIAYWTSENMKDAKPAPGEDSVYNGDGKSSEKTSKPTSDDDAIDPGNAVGKLFFVDPSTGNRYSCSASVITTDDGNIGLTAAHCLYGCQNQFVWYEKMLFCPGYNNDNNGTVFSVAVSYSTTSTTDCSYPTDYGMIKFVYNEKLQDITGSFDWDTEPGDDVSVTVYGYPVDGEIESCIQTGDVLCSWQGESQFGDSSISPTSLAVRHISVNTGHGSSGGPWVNDEDKVIAIVSRVTTHYTESPLFVNDEFLSLISSLS